MAGPLDPTVPVPGPTLPDPNPPPGTPLNPEIPGAPPVPEIPIAPPEGFPAPPPGGTLGAGIAAGAEAAGLTGLAIATGGVVAGATLVVVGLSLVAAGHTGSTGGGSGGGVGTPFDGPGTDAGHDIPVVLAEDEEEGPDEDDNPVD